MSDIAIRVENLGQRYTIGMERHAARRAGFHPELTGRENIYLNGARPRVGNKGGSRATI